MGPNMVKWVAWYRRYWFIIGVALIILGVVGLIGSLLTGGHDLLDLVVYIISILFGVEDVLENASVGRHKHPGLGMRLDWTALYRRGLLAIGVVVIVLSIVGLAYSLEAIHHIVPILLFFIPMILIGVLDVVIALYYT